MNGGYLKTKKVYIFVNGRDHYKSFYIHPKCRMGWNAILAIFSTTLKPSFGAVRTLKTRDGRKFIEGFDDLKHEGKYVACGLEPFKSMKGGYRTNSELEIKTKSTEYYPTETLSAEDQKKYPCLIETMRKGRTIIFVFANGRKSTPKKVVLIKSDYKIWDNILIHIGNILDIPEGVKGLCTIFGQPVCSPYEIQHGGYYVAIPCNATFKKMKYLPSKKTERHHEYSPLVTKGAYISASKTCTSMEDLSGKRGKVKPASVREKSEVKDVKRSSKLESETTEECDCAWEVPEPSSQTNRPEMETKEETLLHLDQLTSAGLDQQDTKGTAAGTQAVDITEHQIQTAEYDQNDTFTQTSTICFESTSDQGNAIIMNEKKFFLITEEQLQQLKAADAGKQMSKLSEELADSFDFHMGSIKERDMEEIRELAGNFVGIITKVSEKMIARTIFGSDYTSAGSNDDWDNMDERVSFIPGAPLDEDKVTKSALSKRDKNQADQTLKSLRLSLPIGRGTIINMEDDEPEPEIIPLKRVSLHSPPVELSDSLMEELHEEYKPLTPARGESMVHQYLVDDDEEEDDDMPYIPFFGLRRDSIGIPLISKLYGVRKESVDEDEIETREAGPLYAETPQEGEPIRDEEDVGELDESTRLDILEDMDLERDKAASITTVENGGEKDTAYVEVGNGTDLIDELNPIKELSDMQQQTVTEVEDLGMKEEIIPVGPIIPQPEAEDTKLGEDVVSEHSHGSIPEGKDAKLDDDIISEHSPNISEHSPNISEHSPNISEHSTTISEHSPNISEHSPNISEHSPNISEHSPNISEHSPNISEHSTNISEHSPKISEHSPNISEHSPNISEHSPNISEHSQISNADIEDEKTSGDIISQHSQVSNVDIEEMKTNSDEISEHSQVSNADIECTRTSGDVILEEPLECIADDECRRLSEDLAPEEDHPSVAELEDTDTNGNTDMDESYSPITEGPDTEKSPEDVPKTKQKKSPKSVQKHHLKNDSEQSLSSTKGSSSQYYEPKALEEPESLYGSLLTAASTSRELVQNPDGSIRKASSSELPVLTQKSKVGSYCVTLNSWISVKVEECDKKADKNHDSVPVQLKNSKHGEEDKNDQQRNVKTEFEEERRRSLLSFMKMRIELALSNKIPELRQPDKWMD